MFDSGKKRKKKKQERRNAPQVFGPPYVACNIASFWEMFARIEVTVVSPLFPYFGLCFSRSFVIFACASAYEPAAMFRIWTLKRSDVSHSEPPPGQ
ncbi:MAG: hypothetical protein ACXV5G_11725 [Halobacteriota archaeon]